MNIAVIGWGSLIWYPGKLARRGRWHRDGPALPIEFARESEDGRLTLVIHAPSRDQTTYWVLSEWGTLDAARENLRERERTRPDLIESASRDEDPRNADGIKARVRAWLRHRDDLDAAIWTGLSATLNGENLVDDAVSYLLSLPPDRHDRAREYVVRAPPQIQTAVRREMQKRGWMDAETASDVFEP
jgi:hypothetical protein